MWGETHSQSKEGKCSKPGKWLDGANLGAILGAPLAGANLEA
jgi:hypothetical protein